MASIFTSQTPSVTDATDGVPYSLGTKFYASAPGEITHGRWFFPATPPAGPVDWVLYDELSEVELSRATFADGASGWRNVALDSPIPYSTPGTVLVAAVQTPDRYVATVGFFVSPVVSGVLVAPGDADNGRLGTGDSYPSSSFSDSCYFVDLVFSQVTTGAASLSMSSSLSVSSRLVRTGGALLSLSSVLSGTADTGTRTTLRPMSGLTVRPDTGTTRRA